MAREKGTGSLQREKSGRYTLRVGINGKRYSRSTRTTDRAKAEQMLDRYREVVVVGDQVVVGVKDAERTENWAQKIQFSLFLEHHDAYRGDELGH